MTLVQNHRTTALLLLPFDSFVPFMPYQPVTIQFQALLTPLFRVLFNVRSRY
jgi:hypothetical protein